MAARSRLGADSLRGAITALALGATAGATADVPVAPRRIGPTCAVSYGGSAAALAEAYGPVLEAAARSRFVAGREAFARHRILTGLAPHEGPAHVDEHRIGPSLPTTVPFPPTLALYDLVFVKLRDDASREVLAALGATPSDRPRLAFFVDLAGTEYDEAKRALPLSFRGAFPAGSQWAAFLGVTHYPALVRVSTTGSAHTLVGRFTAEDLVAHRLLLGRRRGAVVLHALAVCATATLVLGQPAAADDRELFACDPAGPPVGETCRVDPVRTAPPLPALPPAPAASSVPPGSGMSHETEAMLRAYLEGELARQQKETARSPWVKDPNAPESFHRLVEQPSRATALGFLEELVAANRRQVLVQNEIRAAVTDLRQGKVESDVAAQILAARAEIDATRVRARDPGTVLEEIRLERMKRQLERSLAGEAEPSPRPPDGVGRIELVYFFSPSCPYCAAMTPEVEELHRRYGSVLEVVGVPIRLEGETITSDHLREYRAAHDVTFAFEPRPDRIAALTVEEEPGGVPYAVLRLPELPEGPMSVPFTDARTVEDLEAWLWQVLQGLKPGPEGPAPFRASDGLMAPAGAAASAS